MTQAAPKPWKYARKKDSIFDEACPVEDAKGNPVFDKHQEGGCESDPYGFDVWDIAEEDAKLIAAAPELLEACKALTKNLTDHATFGLNDAEVAMLRQAEEAIAKAEGI